MSGNTISHSTGGCQPTLTQSRRAATMSALFIFNACTVTWIEQWYPLTGTGIYGVNLRALVFVASAAAQPHILLSGGAAACHRNNMVHSQRLPCDAGRCLAIATPIPGLLLEPNQQRGGQVSHQGAISKSAREGMRSPRHFNNRAAYALRNIKLSASKPKVSHSCCSASVKERSARRAFKVS